MILQEIAGQTRERVAEQKLKKPLEEVRRRALSKEIRQDFPFEKALRVKDIAFICEVKKASPSKGMIAKKFPYLQIAREYEAAGAAAVSVLTEPYYFQGSNEYLESIARKISIPVLRKDFTVDEYMIYEAKVIGASAILLICSLLSQSQLSEYLELARSLGLSALAEAHDEQEIEMAVKAKASVIGVNNRDLKTFTVDIENSARLRPLVPKSALFVSESGIKTPEDIERLREIGANAVLIGETFMRSSDKKAEFLKLRGKV